jgi:hypothetical protein
MTNENRPIPAALRALQQWSAKPQFEVALALVLSSEEAGDWRISALTWFYAHDDTHTETIAVRLTLASIAAAANAQIQASPDAIAIAVDDAMTIVRKDARAPSARERALQLRMKKASFLVMRNQAETSLRRVLSWAIRRYLTACGHRLRAVSNRSSNEAKYFADAA